MYDSNITNLSTSTLFDANNSADLFSPASEDETPIDANATASILPEELRMFLYVLLITVAAVGVVLNIINMMVFWKLQKEDPINLNLFGLALSDWIVCLTSLMFTLTSGTWYLKDLLKSFKIVQLEVMYLTLGVTHSVSVRITVLLTTSIALQRCLCVVLPLKVKGLFNRPRLTVSVVLSFIVPILMIMVPFYSVNRLIWVTIPVYNKTLLRVVPVDEFYEVNAWSTPINSVLLLIMPFLTVFVCSVIMAKRLRGMMKWRLNVAEVGVAPGGTNSQSSSALAKKEAMVQKENRIVKLVLILSVVLLICYAPNVIIAMVVAFSSSVHIRDIEETLQLVGYTQYLLSTINSSIHIFIYLRSSTNYKTTFEALFCYRRR